jgi:hypothetical protein
MIKCINSNIEIYSDGNYNYNNWNLINNNGVFNILNNTSNRVDFCILPSGNIGLGSTAPKSKLDIIGDVHVLGRTTLSSNLIINNTLSTIPIAQFGTNAIVQSNIYIIGGSSSRLGIGSLSPTVPLDVVGSANISGLITANGGIIVPAGRNLNVVGTLSTIIINTTTVNTANLNVSRTINANGGLISPYGYAIIADGGIYTTSLNATDVINATQGLIVSAGSLLTADGGISATTITASGLITANNGLTIPTGKSLIANGGISTTTIETSGTVTVKSTTETAPIVQYGTNTSAANNIYFVGGGRARIGIGSSSPTVSLDVVGNANISSTISTNIISASGSITGNNIVSTTTIQAGGLITANGGITVPLGKQIVAAGGIAASTISASGFITASALLTATDGIQANTINTTGVINTNSGLISGSTITSSGLITANGGISASTITSIGIINAQAGLSVTSINATAGITGTTVNMSGLIKTTGGLESTTIIASGLLTANNGILASSINSTGVITAGNDTLTTPIAQFGTNVSAEKNLYFVGGGYARVGIGSASPTVSLDVVGDTKITGALTASGGISTTTINASQLITASNGLTTTTVDISNNLLVKSTVATTPITQIGNNTDVKNNLYFIGGGTARIGIGSGSPNNALDIVGNIDITGVYKKDNRDVILDTSNYVLATSNIIVNRLGDYLPYTWIIDSQTFNLNYTLGNVGIGTILPKKKLHIMHPSGELIRIETNAEGANQVSGIEFGIPSYNTETRSKITSKTYSADATSASDLQFSTVSGVNNSSLKLIITPIGNIGIGTPNPLNILQIGNAGRLRIANSISDYTIIGTADVDDTTNTKIELSGNTRGDSQSGNISYVATNTHGSHRFITNSTTERVRITGAGNVGIGTTDPEQLLTLYGNNTKLKIKNSGGISDINKSVAINLENGNEGEWIICNSNSSLAFDYNSSPSSSGTSSSLSTSNRLIIDGVSGNIGIGTRPHIYLPIEASNYKLNIIGDIKVAGDIIPSSSNTYNLGSYTNKWKDLYLSGNSIYLDDLVISRDSNINLNIKDLLGNYRDINLSNVILNNNSNQLTIGIDVDGNITYSTSNKIYYPVTTPYINNTTILDNVNDIILSTSNYAIETSNKLTDIIKNLDNNQSNYVFTTNDTISTRITNLTTDMINENLNGAKKFIINHVYDNSMLINGDLTINSNLIVLGENTRLDTIVYTTERLEVVNANNTSVALIVQQKDTFRDIFVASNLDSNVFTIANNGDVNILGNYKKNNRDVIFDTSNYVLSTSNILVNYANMNDTNNSNYISSTSNILYNNIAYLDVKFKLLTLKVNLNDANATEYTLTSSNNLINKANENDSNASNYILTTSNNLINKANENDSNASNYILTTSNNLINKANENDSNASNYILTTSNNLINKANENDSNASNYILTTSNNLINKANENDSNASNYILTTSNNLINKANENDSNASNYILTTSNNLINKANANDSNASNYILTTSNNLINKANANDSNASNYILTTSNNLINKANENDSNASNYILTTSNNLINKANENDSNASNYILTTSNNLINKANANDSNASNYILTTSNNLINKANANDSNASNYILTTSNNLINKANENDSNASNYILTTSNNLINKANANDSNASNYILTTSNNLINKANENDSNASNYILTTSNNLINKANANDSNASNYILTTSNNLINKANANDSNASNYILTTSNNLINKANENDSNASNYILTTSNNLINKANENDSNASNYILTTSNNLINKANENDSNASNYILTTSNNLINKANENDSNASNYILTTSNLISKRITDLTTDMITENITAANKFIVNNLYNDDLILNGTLTINSNLIVLGDTTQLDTIVYTTERLEVVNANNTTTAFMVQQKTNNRDIFVASNIDTAVFRIANNGDVHINGNGIYKRNNRDMFLDTSNYILTTSNNLINKVKENDSNASNYILTTSNNLINKANENDSNASNYILTTSNNLINKANANDSNASNYILTTSNNLINKANANDSNSSNYILTTSNNLINKANANDSNASNYILTTSNNLINKANENDSNASNYILTTSNNLINKANANDSNASNYILTTSNNLINKANANDSNASNYILTTSNNLINKANANDSNSSNYILTTSNLISKRITDLTTDMITENITAANKFIVNNLYNDDLILNGTLTINSNLIVLGDTTQLDTIVYTTERLEVVNANNTTTAFMVQQKTNNRDIFVASNIDTAVFRIANNGDVHINGDGIYKRNNRDMFLDTSNYILTTSNNLINKANENDSNASNYILTTSNNLINKVKENDNNTSNYILTTSNILSDRLYTLDQLTSNIVNNSISTLNIKVNANDQNASNYILSTSNILSDRLYTLDQLTSNIVNNSISTLNIKVNANDQNASNYILTTSNILSDRLYTLDQLTSNIVNNSISTLNIKVNANDLNASNYILTTSNILSDRLYTLDQLTSNIVNNSISTLNIKVNANDQNASNYILSTSNILSDRLFTLDQLTSNIVNNSISTLNIKVNANDQNASNYILTTSNILSDRLYTLDQLTSNIVNNSISTLNIKVNANDSNSSNYVLSTSNIISKRITDLTTDMITENIEAANKFIVNNRYNNNLELNGTLTVNSNLIVLGESTQLDTTVYTTERLEIVNANNTATALMVQQNSADRDIFIASNIDMAVFKIANNGDVHIYGNGNYKKNNRDVILDTSNYILTTSNNLINKANENDSNTSNYILSTSNILSDRLYTLDQLTSNIVNNSISTLNIKVNANDLNASNYILSTSNILSDRLYTLDQLTSNIVNNSISTLNIKVNANDQNASNYILSTSNILSDRLYTLDQLTSNIVNNSISTLNIKVNANDLNASNYILSTSNILSDRLYTLDQLTSNIVNNSISTLNIKVNANDQNASNYISDVNSSLINQINELNTAQLNYVLTTSSNLGDGLTTVIYNMNVNDRNISNYVFATSNRIERRINETTTDKIVEGTKNKFIIDNKFNSNLEINGNLVVNSNLIVNSLATLRNNLDITGDVNFTGELYKNGMVYPNGKTYTGSSSILSQFSPIQTQFTMYKNVVEKTGTGWQFIDNNINVVDDKVQGFCVRIKPNHYSSKILINLNCHIGIDYGSDARWWGLRLYRKIGEAGTWEHITEADGTDYNNNNGTTCWLSHNLGAESSTYSYFIANISGAYYDIPGVSEDYIYYTVKWCSLLGDNTQNGKLYLNRPAVINSLNTPIVSSSWNISEIWQLETSYFPKGGIVTKYTPTQTQFNIYKNVVEKISGGWQFIDNDTSIVNNNIRGFCVRIRPNHYTSKILINLNCHIGIDYGTDARWWGLRLFRRIGETGEWVHITDADGNNGNVGNDGTPCWLSHNLGAESSTYSYLIANVSGAYYDVPNAMDTYVYYTAKWCSQLGDELQNGKLYLNRPATYNSANSAVLSSSWNAQEIWQRETTFIPKNAVICQNMSIQTLFNIYRNIVIKTGYGWQFIDNNINIINEKIQGFCVRIKPTHPSSKVLVHLSCHIGIDYGTDARWWGLRLYRKIGEAGTWEHITDADGTNLIDNKGTTCWLSHNLGAESSTSSYFVANISGSFFDLPGTSSDFVYYTAKWCSILGDDSLEGKIYLNRPATYNDDNSAVLSSSWNAQEIWQLGTPYEPTEYSIINIFNNNNVGIGTTNPVCKLDVNGTINAINYSTISDRRYKKDIREVNSSLELINRLNPVSYLTIAQNEGDKRNYGFIAQDLHDLIPEAVNVPTNESHNYTIDYMLLIPLLTKSIQELTEKINTQQKTIDDLSARLNANDSIL